MANPLVGNPSVHQQIQVQNGDDLDRVWQAYFDNPNQAYIHQILEVINQNEQIGKNQLE